MNYVDGTKFPPICIFKGKRLSRGEQIPSGVFAWFQQSGWMDANLMKKYVDYIKDLVDIGPTMIVYDYFRGHLEESVKKKFHDNGFDIVVIPGGLTNICQPLDVTINKPFKDNLRREWHAWMVEGGAGITAAGNLRRAKLSDVCWWVKRAWERIPEEMIIKSFKTCKISTSLNGSDNEISDNDVGDDESSDDDIGDDGSSDDDDGDDGSSDDGSSDDDVGDGSSDDVGDDDGSDDNGSDDYESVRDSDDEEKE